MSKIVQRLLKTKIKPEEIIALVQEMTRQHEEGREADWESSVITLVRQHPGQPKKVHCISERMRCLFEMSRDARMRGWTIEGPEPGCLLTSEAIFRAAALCPLRAKGDEVQFDADEFFGIALGETPSEGRS